MTKLEELNKELTENNLNQTEIINKINIEYKLEQMKQTEKYKYLIGKCFKLKNAEHYCYKILNIVQINSYDDIYINTLMCQLNDIYKYKTKHNIENVTEITKEQFESNLIQACNNMK